MNQLIDLKGGRQIKTPTPIARRPRILIDEVFGIVLIEVWHIIDRDKRVRFVFEFFGDHLELHKHLAPSGAIGLDNPHGASRRDPHLTSWVYCSNTEVFPNPSGA